MWASQLNAREKVYRKVNRCGASPSEGCRYVCETICEHKDPKIFPGFKSDGSVHKTCHHNSGGGGTSQVEPGGMVEASRSGGSATAAAAAADEDDDAELETTSRPSARNEDTSAASSSSFAVAPRRASSSSGQRGLLQDDTDHLRGARGFRGGHHHHQQHSSHNSHSHGVGVSTPFYQDLKNWGTGYTCYEKCRQTCEVRVMPW